MKRILFVAVVMLLIFQVLPVKAATFEISSVNLKGEQMILWPAYGGNIELEKGKNVIPLIIELHVSSHSATIRKFLEEKGTTVVFPNLKDFHVFSLFLRKTSDNTGPCRSDNQCSVYVFF